MGELLIKKQQKKPIILFPINANPLHFGHLIMLNHLIPLSSKIYIVLYDHPEVIDTNSSIFLLESILKNYKCKYKLKVMASKTNFTEINELPKEFIDKKAFYIATCSKKIYSNLASKGYPYLIFLKKPFGWNDFYQSIAFLRSIALANIEHLKFKSIMRE